MNTEQITSTELTSLNCGEAQLGSFRENGFMRIPNAIPVQFLEKLKAALHRLSQTRAHVDARITGSDEKEYFVNAGNLCYRGEDIFVELLGSPLMLSLAETICGEDFFPIQEFAVIKNLGDNNCVKWHQDVNNGMPGKTFMVGIYLDDADENNGALRVIPRSHRSGAPICELEKQPSVSINMQPGDILIHDLMIAHSSGVLKTNQQRRVVYFEFMSASHARSENIYPEEFIRIRTRLIPVAMKKYSELNSGRATFQWKHPESNLISISDDLQKELDAIYQHHMKVKPANYCFDFLLQSYGMK